MTEEQQQYLPKDVVVYLKPLVKYLSLSIIQERFILPKAIVATSIACVVIRVKFVTIQGKIEVDTLEGEVMDTKYIYPNSLLRCLILDLESIVGVTSSSENSILRLELCLRDAENASNIGRTNFTQAVTMSDARDWMRQKNSVHGNTECWNVENC